MGGIHTNILGGSCGSKHATQQTVITKPSKIFTLALLIKHYNPQGFFNPYTESIRSYYLRLGIKANISYQSFKPLFDKLLAVGYKKAGNNGNVQLLGRKELICVLGIDADVSRLNQSLRDINIHTLPINAANKAILRLFIINSFKAQAYNIQKKKLTKDVAIRIAHDQNKVIARTDIKRLKRLTKEAKKKGVDTKEYCKEYAETNSDDIVTGSIFLSKKLKISQSTANKLLNELHNDGLIKRTIVKQKTFKSATKYLSNTFTTANSLFAITVIGSIISLCSSI